MTTDKDPISRKLGTHQKILADAVRAFRAGEITQKEMTARTREADKLIKEIKQRITDERKRK